MHQPALQGRCNFPPDVKSLLVWCKACYHQPPADLRAIVDVGRRDVPLKDLHFRCTSCGSALTDFVVMSRDALGVQPWRADADAEPSSTGAGHLRGQQPWRSE